MEHQLAGGEPQARAVPAASSAAAREFAQAFLTLENVCSLYPEGHQARAAPAARLLELLSSEARESGEGSVACVEESVLWRGAALENPDPTVLKFASLLGSLGIMRLTWSAGLTADELVQFMSRVTAARGAGHRSAWDDATRFEHLRIEGPDYSALMAAGDGQDETGRGLDLWRDLLLRTAGAGAGLPADDDPARLREAATGPAGGSLAPGEVVGLLGDNFALDPARIEQLTRVFQHLVPRRLDRMELAPQVRDRIRAAAAPDDPLADNVWEEVQELLTGEAGDFMSASYREQLRRLAAREAGRRGQEAALAVLPELAAALEPAHTAGEALLIQLEQARLATSPSRYRDALEGLAGVCGASLAAGDRERGMMILQRLLELRAGDEPLAGPRTDIEHSLKAIATAPVVGALVTLLPSLSPGERAAAGTFAALAHEAVVPVLLDALAAEDDPARRSRIATLLEQSGPGMLNQLLQRFDGAPDAAACRLLPLIAAGGGADAAPALIAALGRGEPQLRRDALQALLRIDTDEVRRALPRLLDDPDLEIAQAAAGHLGTIGSPEKVRELLGVLAAGHFSGRRAGQTQRAIFVLGQMRAPEAVAPLGRLLLRRTWITRRGREQAREEAAKALDRIATPEARAALEQAANSDSAKVAALCRRLLGRRGGG